MSTRLARSAQAMTTSPVASPFPSPSCAVQNGPTSRAQSVGARVTSVSATSSPAAARGRTRTCTLERRCTGVAAAVVLVVRPDHVGGVRVGIDGFHVVIFGQRTRPTRSTADIASFDVAPGEPSAGADPEHAELVSPGVQRVGALLVLGGESRSRSDQAAPCAPGRRVLPEATGSRRRRPSPVAKIFVVAAGQAWARDRPARCVRPRGSAPSQLSRQDPHAARHPCLRPGELAPGRRRPSRRWRTRCPWGSPSTVTSCTKRPCCPGANSLPRRRPDPVRAACTASCGVRRPLHADDRTGRVQATRLPGRRPLHRRAFR